ncbi:MAG: hypothetical protein F9K48_03530 [Candidatus Brocadia sp.]|nr:MAG: hypothetical protein F9K48_03530 [Candidatus Brocadia sp.]
MINTIPIFFRFLLITASVFCFYIAFLLYEDEEGKLQNKLEEWWIKINDAKSTSLSRQTRFMRHVSGLVCSWIDRIFGKQLFSLQSAGSSLWYSLATFSFIFFLLALSHKAGHFTSFSFFTVQIGDSRLDALGITMAGPAASPSYLFCIVVVTMFFLWFGILPTLVPKRIYQFTWTLILLLIAIYVFQSLGYSQTTYEVGIKISDKFGPFPLMVRLTVTSLFIFCLVLINVTFVAIFRYTLRCTAGLDSAVKILFVIAVNLPISVGLFIALRKLLLLMTTMGLEPSVHCISAALIGMLVPACVFPVLTFMLHLLLILVMLLHRLFWPFLDRSLYTLQRFGIARRPKVIFSLGIVLAGIFFDVKLKLLWSIIGKML